MKKTATGAKPSTEKEPTITKGLKLPPDLLAKYKLVAMKKGISLEDALREGLFRALKLNAPKIFPQKVASPTGRKSAVLQPKGSKARRATK